MKTEQKRTSLAYRAIGAVVALLLCVGMTPAIPAAYASDVAPAQAAQTAGKATLTIVYGLNFDGTPNVKVNKTFDFYKDATMEDLLAAAKAAGEIKDYAMNGWGGVASVTFSDATVAAQDETMSLYWANYVNGTYADGTVKDTVLADGAAYQLAWSSYPTAVAPADWSAVGKPGTGTGSAGTPGDRAGSATLAIVYGLKFDGAPTVVINKTFDFYEDATMEDLLAAAKTAGDIKDYAMNGWGGVSSLTLLDGTVVAQNATMSLYWANYVNGAYADGTVKNTSLVDGATYQLAWCSYPTATAPENWSAVGAASAGQGSAGTAPSGDDKQPEVTHEPTDNAAAGYTDLMKSIADSYNGCGTGWQAMDMAAIGRAAQVDRNAVLAEAKAAYDQPGTTNLQAAIIAVTALGYDATSLTVDGTKIDLVDKMAQSSVSTQFTNGQAFALLAYASGDYAVPANALRSLDDLVSGVKNAQLADGSFAFAGTTADPDMTAMVITALQPYLSKDDVAKVVDKAMNALRGLQNPDGGWGGSWPAATGATNADSTAVAIIALCAMGIDPATQWATENGSTPLGALLAQTNDDKTGFLFNGKTNELATEQGFRALAAYQGMKNTTAAYNIYTQAQRGQAALSEQDVNPTVASDDSVAADKASKVSPVSAAPAVKAGVTAKTADSTGANVVAAAALCTLMISAATLRRSRRNALRAVK